MDEDGISRELVSLSRFLAFAYLPRTAAFVSSLTPVRLRSAEPWHTPLMRIYQEEALSSFNLLGEPDPEHHRALLDGMDRLVQGASAKPDTLAEFLQQMHPLLVATGESHGNTRELYRSFVAPGSSTKHVYLNLCLMYLILCEGVFRNLGLFVLGLHDIVCPAGPNGGGQNPSLETLGDRLRQVGLGAFAAGYDRHVRNAIAHGHFVYSAGGNTMRFRDYDYRRGKVTFEEVWPFEKFVRQYAKLDDVYLLVGCYLQLWFLPMLGAPGRDG
jgi:hypothetical protein